MGFYSWYRPVFKHVCITEFQIKFTSNWFITIANKNGLEYKTNVTYIDCARSLNGKSQKQTNHLTAIRLKFIYYIWRNDKGNMTFSSMEQCLFNRYICWMHSITRTQLTMGWWYVLRPPQKTAQIGKRHFKTFSSSIISNSSSIQMECI